MKKIIISILYGSIIPALFFIVGKNKRLKDDTKIDYVVAWGIIFIIWVLATIVIHVFMSKNKKTKEIKKNSG